MCQDLRLEPATDLDKRPCGRLSIPCSSSEVTRLELDGAVRAPWRVRVAHLARAVRPRANIPAMPDPTPPAPPLAARMTAEAAQTPAMTRPPGQAALPPSATGCRRGTWR